MSDSPQPKQHGGTRPGAGRRPTGVVAFHCYPQGSTVERVRAVARATKRTLGQVIDAACLHAMPQVEPPTPPVALSVEPLPTHPPTQAEIDRMPVVSVEPLREDQEGGE